MFTKGHIGWNKGLTKDTDIRIFNMSQKMRLKPSISKRRIRSLRGIHDCKYCGKIFPTPCQLGGHTARCINNPNRSKTIEKDRIRATMNNKSSDPEVRKKISIGVRKFLNKNPDRVPYILNHSSKESYPEHIFDNALKSNNFSGYKHPYRFGIYEFDFAFPELLIDVDIDGGTHKLEKVIRIDKIRDEYTKSMGWTVIRFTSDDVIKNIDKCIDTLRRSIEDHIPFKDRDVGASPSEAT